MNIEPKRQAFIVAVSGGVDSVVLLDKLVNNSEILGSKKPILIVAHFDHGIRSDSHLDLELVRKIAKKYDLKFEFSRANLGRNASEDKARFARYQFLLKLKDKYNASMIVLGHHRDDQIETAIFNITRGSGFRGLGSLRERQGIARPLLNMSKQQIYQYAQSKGLKWREDSTNKDLRYSRNFIRQKVISKFDPKAMDKWGQIISSTIELINEIDNILEASWVKNRTIEIRKYELLLLPKAVGYEIIASALRKTDPDIELSRNLLEELYWFTLSASTGKVLLLKKCKLSINQDNFLIVAKH